VTRSRRESTEVSRRLAALRAHPSTRTSVFPAVDAALGELLRTDRLLKSASLSVRQALEERLLRLWAIRPDRASRAA
jgi:hypothetical protein